MSKKVEFLADPDLDSDANANSILIEFLSGGWGNYKIVSLEREKGNDDTHQNGWTVIHIKEDNV